MDMQAISNLIQNMGFPVFVAVWMLFKNSKDVDLMNNTLNELKTAITTLTIMQQENYKKDVLPK